MPSYKFRYPDIPFTEDRATYDFLVSVVEIIKQTERYLQDIDARLTRAGV